ncbi:hypothetical protein Cni_G01739 [Canna indica]|uniref:Uncharacterized protein n=1 Tax=Canna indica TaxID=4628 RepID=A0AAQ3JNR7_9LILI|nr:hypothetical protein Cni_G01739 [Canna indica]
MTHSYWSPKFNKCTMYRMLLKKIGGYHEEPFEEIEQHNIVALNASSDPAHDDPSLARDDVEGILIDTPIMLAAMRDERFDTELQNDDDVVGLDVVGS